MFAREPVCQKPTPGFMGEVEVQIWRRKKLMDQIGSDRQKGHVVGRILRGSTSVLLDGGNVGDDGEL